MSFLAAFCPYCKEIFERFEGKVTDKIEQTGKDSAPAIFTVVYENCPKAGDSGKSEGEDGRDLD